MTDAAIRGPGAGGPPAGAAAAAGPPVITDWTKLMLGFGAMVTGQFMAVLDIQIVAASLPQIQAGVGASADEIGWVQTSYLIAEVVMIPLAGYLSRLWGTRNVYFVSCLGFVVMSVLTGLSNSIEQMIFFRALQGFIGGAMIPTVFAVAFTAFPPEKRNVSGVVMGMIITLAPTIGPTLGGHLTEWLSWRWLFFINVVPGIAVMALVWRYGDFDKGDPRLAKGFDFPGLAVMAVFLMSMQYVLEEGQREGWDSDIIVILAATALVTGVIFIWRQLTYRNPIVELRAFSNINFLVGTFMTFVSGMTLFGGTYLLPQFLARVRHYSSAEVGTTMVISGLSMFVTGPIIGRWIRQNDPRIPMIVGFGLVAYGMYLGHAATKDWGFWEWAGVQAFRGVGVMVAMIATQQVTMATLPPEQVKSAAGLVNLARNVGGAVALALLSNTLSRQSVTHYTELSARVPLTDGQAQGMMTGLAERMQQLGVADPEGAAYKAFAGMIQQQAQVLAFGDSFLLLAGFGVAAAALALLARPVKNPPPPPADAH